MNLDTRRIKSILYPHSLLNLEGYRLSYALHTQQSVTDRDLHTSKS